MKLFFAFLMRPLNPRRAHYLRTHLTLAAINYENRESILFPQTYAREIEKMKEKHEKEKNASVLKSESRFGVFSEYYV
jgi:hypothetical protein